VALLSIVTGIQMQPLLLLTLFPIKIIGLTVPQITLLQQSRPKQLLLILPPLHPSMSKTLLRP
jgi:hypothetical protein